MTLVWRGVDVTRFVTCEHGTHKPTRGYVAGTIERAILGRLYICTTDCCNWAKRDFGPFVNLGLVNLGQFQFICEECYQKTRADLYRIVCAYVYETFPQTYPNVDIRSYAPALRCLQCKRVLCDTHWKHTDTTCMSCTLETIRSKGIVPETVPLLTPAIRRLFKTLLLVRERSMTSYEVPILPLELWIRIGLQCLYIRHTSNAHCNPQISF